MKGSRLSNSGPLVSGLTFGGAKMYDLRGLIELVAAYPVHIMSFIGCVMLFGLVLPKRKRQQLPLTSSESRPEKRGLTHAQKTLLVGKIQSSGTENLRKSFAGKANPVYVTLVMIGLVAVFFLWVLLVLPKL